MVTSFCVKCKVKREMTGAKHVKMKSGMGAMTGTCPKCSTKMFRILGKGK